MVGNSSCTPCPGESVTSTAAAIELSRCICDVGFGTTTGAPNDCSLCAVGLFAPAQGLGACTACPPYTTTRAVGATDISMCVCIAGFSGLDGGPCTRMLTANCRPHARAHASLAHFDLAGARTLVVVMHAPACPSDTYKDVVGSDACAACPANSFTNGASGATSVAQCICPPGYTGANGTSCNGTWAGPIKTRARSTSTHGVCKPLAMMDLRARSCTACPAGSYKSDAGSASCTPCAPKTTTAELAAISSTACTCAPGFSGPNAQACAGTDNGRPRL